MTFFTATINSWKHLLQKDERKDIIINSLIWLDKEDKVYTHGFVIMPNHIHFLWTVNDPEYEAEHSFLSFTAHAFKKHLKQDDPTVLDSYRSTQYDREYHFWERRSRTIDVKSREIAVQKLDYIHNNPLQEKWQLVSVPEDYHYSSARYYVQQPQPFSFIRHYADFI